MDRPDDLDVKSTQILEALRHAEHDGHAYWPAVHAMGTLVAELVRLRGEREAMMAWMRRGDECCVANAKRIENGEHRREEER